MWFWRYVHVQYTSNKSGLEMRETIENQMPDIHVFLLQLFMPAHWAEH